MATQTTSSTTRAWRHLLDASIRMQVVKASAFRWTTRVAVCGVHAGGEPSHVTMEVRAVEIEPQSAAACFVANR